MTGTASAPTKDRLREDLDATRQRLFEAISGLTEEQMRRRPDDGQWSVAEVLAHLPVCERRLSAQARAVSVRPGASIEFLSEEERAESAGRGRRLPVPALIHDLVAARWETTSFLGSLRAGEMSRSGYHQELGRMSVAQVLGVIASHEGGHVAQIRTVRQALGM